MKIKQRADVLCKCYELLQKNLFSSAYICYEESRVDKRRRMEEEEIEHCFHGQEAFVDRNQVWQFLGRSSQQLANADVDA